MNQARERGRSPAAANPVEDAAEIYLSHTDGNPSEALRLAVADVLQVSHLAGEIGHGTSWGFLRRKRSEVFAPDPN